MIPSKMGLHFVGETQKAAESNTVGGGVGTSLKPSTIISSPSSLGRTTNTTKNPKLPRCWFVSQKGQHKFIVVVRVLKAFGMRPESVLFRILKPVLIKGPQTIEQKNSSQQPDANNLLHLLSSRNCTYTTTHAQANQDRKMPTVHSSSKARIMEK